MEQEQKFKGIKYTKTISVIAALIVIALVVAYIFNIFSEGDLPFQLFAALLGVMITVAITAFLLNNQTEQQQLLMEQQRKAEKERQSEDRKFQNQLQKEKQKLEQQSKVFEKKLEIYQEYLELLCAAIEDGKLSKKEKLELQFHTSYIAMHTDPDHIIKISEGVKDILQKGCGPKDRDNDIMHLESLFKIVQCFREELYKDDKESMQIDEKKMGKTRTIFEEAYSYAEEPEDDDNNPIPQKTTVYAEPQNNVDALSHPEIKEIEEVDLSLWDNAIEKWESEGLNISKDFQNTNELRIDFKSEQPATIDIIYKKGNYVIQADYFQSGDFAQQLKWYLPPGVTNSKRNYWQWWTNGNEQLKEIKNGELFDKISRSQELQKYIILIIDDLIYKIRKSKVTCEVRREFDKNFVPDYSFWERTKLYEFSTLYTESINETEEGRIFIDLYDTRFSEQNEEYKDKPILMVMYNREEDEEKLEKTLERIGLDNVERSICNRVLLESFNENTPVKEIAEKLNYWMDRILIKTPS